MDTDGITPEPDNDRKLRLGISAIRCPGAPPVGASSIHAFHATSGLVVLLFAGGVLATTLLTFRTSMTRPETTDISLCVPFAANTGARLGGYWHTLGPGLFQYEPLVAMAATGFGLAILSWAVLQRTGDTVPADCQHPSTPLPPPPHRE